MKEFEKWDGAENRCRKCEVEQSMCNMVNDSIACKAIRKEAWKAALETVNSKLWLATGQVADEVKGMAWINEELEVEDL